MHVREHVGERMRLASSALRDLCCSRGGGADDGGASVRACVRARVCAVRWPAMHAKHR